MNLLIALFFACSDLNELGHDGVVYIFPNIPAGWIDDLLVDLIMDFVFEYSPNMLYLECFLETTKNKYKNVTNRLIPKTISELLHYLTIPAFAVIPKNNNIRLITQEGHFLYLI